MSASERCWNQDGRTCAAGATHEWKGWSFEMRHYVATVDEVFYIGLLNDDANPFRKLLLRGMSDPQRKRSRQLVFMLMMHTKD